MKRTPIAPLTLALCLSFITQAARGDDKADVIAGAKAWVAALSGGDADALKARSVGTDAELARWTGMSKMMSAMKKLGEAATAKFGDQAAMLSRMSKAPDFAATTADAQVEVAGDDATLAGKNGNKIKLKKDGDWKIVLASLPPAGRMDDKQVATMTDAFSTTADEVTAGKHATAIAAMQSLAVKMQAARGATPPAGK